MKDRPKISLNHAVRITLPWQFPSVDLPRYTEGYVRPANNLPGRDQYWLEHPAIEHEYGVLLHRQDFEFLYQSVIDCEPLTKGQDTMKDNTLEYEGYSPFDVIAGSSVGGWSNREIATEIIRHCVILSSDSGTAERLYRELAKTPDDDIDVDAWTYELEETAIDSLPPYCTLTWQDNELTVLPYIDDDLPCIDRHLDHYAAGPGKERTYEYIHVNDHGNADLFVWNNNKRDFDLIWSIV